MKTLLHISLASLVAFALALWVGCDSRSPAPDGATGSSEPADSDHPDQDHPDQDHADHDHADHDHGDGDHAEDAHVADPHDVPLTEEEIATLKEQTATYTEAVQHIQKFKQTIAEETTAGEPAKAHRALDNLDIVLENLTASARNSEIPRSQWQTINETAQELRDLFNRVHANIDEGKDPNYGDVASEVDQAIEFLKGIETPDNGDQPPQD